MKCLRFISPPAPILPPPKGIRSSDANKLSAVLCTDSSCATWLRPGKSAVGLPQTTPAHLHEGGHRYGELQRAGPGRMVESGQGTGLPAGEDGDRHSRSIASLEAGLDHGLRRTTRPCCRPAHHAASPAAGRGCDRRRPSGRHGRGPSTASQPVCRDRGVAGRHPSGRYAGIISGAVPARAREVFDGDTEACEGLKMPAGANSGRDGNQPGTGCPGLPMDGVPEVGVHPEFGGGGTAGWAEPSPHFPG